MMPAVYTVAQVNRYVKSLLDDDVILQELFMQGEMSNVYRHTSGHVYFTLKDDKAALSAVMFASQAQGLAFVPENGLKVIAFGRVSLYEKSGQYQFVAELLEPAGAGALHVAFEQLKAKLLAEGLFDADRKKPIPTHPACVAVVTSPTGAAVHDIIQVAKRRDKGVYIVVSPARVQGDGAAESIAQAIRLVNGWGRADVIIVGRGGGSAEDLWAFNEEVVARAIFASKIPVISAVGHETDFTIADFVSDLRAPTPSAAAELAVFNMEDARERFIYQAEAMRAAMGREVENRRNKLDALMRARPMRQPLAPVLSGRGRLSLCLARMERETRLKLAQGRRDLNGRQAILRQLSPEAALKRGYALVQDKRGVSVRAAGGLTLGQPLLLRFHDGCATAVVESVEIDAPKAGEDYGG